MLPSLNKLRTRPEFLLFAMAAAMPIAFGTWQALLNNFAIEQAAFTGVEIGILQSLREVPGFLAFAVIFLLFVFKEQTLALLSLGILGIGTALTGYFPNVLGLYITTAIMSVGFHYYETLNQSLSLQWFEKRNAAHNLGRMIAIGSSASLVSFAMVWLTLEWLQLPMKWVYLIGGGVTFIIALLCGWGFPKFPEKVEQHKKLILRKRYWLYYALTFMAGARRQIFVVFAGFLMVEKFNFSAGEIALMFLANCALNMLIAPKIGRLIDHWGERKALTLEYVGLIGVFVCYAFVNNPWLAVALYIIDHLFFSLAIAQKTYFQKIADPADIAPTAGVAFTINHIAAVVLPVCYGLLWSISPAAVFLSGAALAAISLLLSQLIPSAPTAGNETQWSTPDPIESSG
ncbi:MAG: MFS transporter [Motiliproteus sp.]|nr:MFS transporter [Motiliproteus sp.]MCW9054288.1 MFS transporter [Motiliproteus sp.]